MERQIRSKAELKEFIRSDASCLKWQSVSRGDRLFLKFTNDTQYLILRFLKYARTEEYLSDCGKGKLTILRLWLVKRKKNRLGQRLNIELYTKCFGKGLTIDHGGIVVNPSVRFGAHCTLHGQNCIGNNGTVDLVPTGGDNVDIGIGAKLIGDIHLGSDIKIGANAVVNKPFPDDHLLLVGVPAAVKARRD